MSLERFELTLITVRIKKGSLINSKRGRLAAFNDFRYYNPVSSREEVLSFVEVAKIRFPAEVIEQLVKRISNLFHLFPTVLRDSNMTDISMIVT